MDNRFEVGKSFYIIKDLKTGINYNLSFSGDINRLCELLNKLSDKND